MAAALALMSASAVAWPAAGVAQTASPAPAPSGDTAELVVTAQRLNEARAAIEPQLGASTYTISSDAIKAMPGGDNTALNQVILQAPGVVQDSFGQLHVRGEHNGLQYRLNGVILPEGLSVFGQALNPRLADKVELITGALPAQYGLRTAGIVDITTKSGVFQSGGAVSLYGGSHQEFQPSFEVGGSAGALNYFVSGSFLTDALGIESPDGRSTPLHDRTRQFEGFAYVEDIIDPSTRVSAILGTSDQTFQIPDLSGAVPSLLFGPAGDQPLVVDGQTTFPSAALNENQQEITHYGVLSLLHTTAKATGQLSLFARYSTLSFTPDPLGDLLFTGIAQSAHKKDIAAGFQAEGVYDLTLTHTLRAGLIGEIDRASGDTTSQVIGLDAAGAQTTDQPLTIVDASAATAKTLSAYLQDEWEPIGNLTVNYGLRFDLFDAFRNEHQLSPRLNIVWLPAPSTTVHLGYARYFSPPPFELVANETVAKFDGTTGASTCPDADPRCASHTPLSERANYFDAGVSQRLGRLTLGVDSYCKLAKDLVDEGQFGAPIILTPFNYADGRQYGVELNAGYHSGGFSAYANFAYVKNQGRHIVSSEFNFTPADLAFIAAHYIYLDHDQTYTASAGASYLWRGTRVGADLLYGSGLRATGADGVPNGEHLPGYVQVNLSASHRLDGRLFGPIEVRLDVTNAFDAVYEIRNGTGVGVGAPQFGPRRGLFAGVTKEF
jgi:outer membrane receptor protein involved in Fe transport